MSLNLDELPRNPFAIGVLRSVAPFMFLDHTFTKVTRNTIQCHSRMLHAPI